jgi:hypothetical protein
MNGKQRVRQAGGVGTAETEVKEDNGEEHNGEKEEVQP